MQMNNSIGPNCVSSCVYNIEKSWCITFHKCLTIGLIQLFKVSKTQQIYLWQFSGSSSSSSSSSSSEEEEVPLHNRRRAARNVTYNMKEYDEMIKKALQDEEPDDQEEEVEEEVVEPEPKPVRRGKDMATIMEVVEGKDKAEAQKAAGEESDLEEEEEKDSDDEDEEQPEQEVEAPKPVKVRLNKIFS